MNLKAPQGHSKIKLVSGVWSCILFYFKSDLVCLISHILDLLHVSSLTWLTSPVRSRSSVVSNFSCVITDLLHIWYHAWFLTSDLRYLIYLISHRVDLLHLWFFYPSDIACQIFNMSDFSDVWYQLSDLMFLISNVSARVVTIYRYDGLSYWSLTSDLTYDFSHIWSQISYISDLTHGFVASLIFNSDIACQIFNISDFSHLISTVISRF